MKLFTIDKYEGDRKWAFNINIGDRQFSLIIPTEWDINYDGLGFKSNHPNRFIHSEKVISFITPWIWFEYTHSNYNKIIHIIVDEDIHYYTKQPVAAFIATLKQWVNRKALCNPPFSFNYDIKENGKYVFYITLPNGWFVKHNLGVFEQYTYPDCYLPTETIKRVFPKYNKHINTVKTIKKDDE